MQWNRKLFTHAQASATEGKIRAAGIAPAMRRRLGEELSETATQEEVFWFFVLAASPPWLSMTSMVRRGRASAGPVQQGMLGGAVAASDGMSTKPTQQQRKVRTPSASGRKCRHRGAPWSVHTRSVTHTRTHRMKDPEEEVFAAARILISSRSKAEQATSPQISSASQPQ